MKTISIGLFIFCVSCPGFGQYFWTEQNSGVTVQLTSVSDINRTVAWVCGYSGTVVRTSDGGYNWTNLSGNGIPSTVSLVNIFGIDLTTALTAGYIGTTTYVYRTSNSGASWTQVFTQANGFMNVIWMVTAQNGFMEGDPVGGRWSLWRTTNGGVNWDSAGLHLLQAGGEAGWNNALWMTGSKIWFGTNNTRVYYSSNSGLSWTAQSTAPELNSYALSLDSIPGFTGFAGGANLMRTINGGSNWSSIVSLGSGNFSGIAYPQSASGAECWYVRSNNSIYYTLNSGGGWSVQYTASLGTYRHIAMSRDGIIWGPGGLYAVRNNGGISRCNGIIEGVRIISDVMPASFNLYQNYPNPFNATTRIRFDSPRLEDAESISRRGALIKIVVFDVTGRIAATIVEEVIQPGTYEAEWNAGNVSSGMYFYRLTATDPMDNRMVFSEARKLVLLK